MNIIENKVNSSRSRNTLHMNCLEINPTWNTCKWQGMTKLYSKGVTGLMQGRDEEWLCILTGLWCEPGFDVQPQQSNPILKMKEFHLILVPFIDKFDYCNSYLGKYFTPRSHHGLMMVLFKLLPRKHNKQN
jgi:hypothetical protein